MSWHPLDHPVTDRSAGIYISVWRDDGLFLKALSIAEFEFTDTLNDIGAFRVVVTGDDIGDLGIYNPNRTRFVLIERVDGGRTVDEFLGRIEKRTRHKASTPTGTLSSVEISGPSVAAILDQPVIAYPAGSIYADKSGAADDLMKAYVRENMGSSAQDASRRLSSSYFDVEANQSVGQTVSYAGNGRVLLDVLQDLADASSDAGTPLYFGLVRTPTATNPMKLTFRVRAWSWSTDRGSGSANELVLSYEEGTLENPTLTEDWGEVDNVCYLPDVGSEDAQLLTAYTTANATSGIFTRSEKYVAGTRQATAAQREAQAAAELAMEAPRLKLTGDMKHGDNLRYGWDYEAGTRVIAAFEGERFDAIVGTVSAQGDARGLTARATVSAERAASL